MTEYQSVFTELTGDSETKETTLQNLEEFVYVMHGKKKSTTVNNTRLDMFLNKYKTKEDQRINSAETLDRSSMPPCFSVLQEKIKRSAYISKVWYKLFLWCREESCPKKLGILIDHSPDDTDDYNDEEGQIFLLALTFSS